MSNVTTSDDRVPAFPELPPTGSPRGRPKWFWAWVGGIGGAVLAGLVAFALIYELPYYALRPGEVRPTEAAITVEGAEVFPSDGEIDFTTVRVRRMSPFDALVAWWDDDIDVLSEEELLGPRNAEENRQFNIQLMDTAKLDAVRVALTHLGYDVPIRVDGQIIIQVDEGTPADGLLSVGDVIVGVGDADVVLAESLADALSATRPGDSVVLRVEGTDGVVRDVSLELGTRPDGLPQGFIGVGLAPRDPVYDFPFDVTIDSGNVGGPSAGLAFTLAVLDALTPGELTGGIEVAVTGEIEADGSVGRVGGVAQKAAAVRDAGIGVFLVPAGLGGEARRTAGDEVQVVEVGSLSDALAALDSLGGNALDIENTGGHEAALAGD